MAFGLGSIFDAMVTRGWSTLGAFAFSCSAPPGVMSPTGTDVFYTEVASDLADGNVNSPLAPGLRRLFFESWTCSSADLKHRMEKRDGEPPRKMPAVEREDRRRRPFPLWIWAWPSTFPGGGILPDRSRHLGGQFAPAQLPSALA